MSKYSVGYLQALIGLHQPQLRIATFASTACAVHLLLDPVNATTGVGVCTRRAFNIDVLDFEILAHFRAGTNQVANQW
jgi:hypothetical protein